jgi:hypothetical protein
MSALGQFQVSVNTAITGRRASDAGSELATHWSG